MASWLDVDIPTFSTLLELTDWVDSWPNTRMMRAIIDSLCKMVI